MPLLKECDLLVSAAINIALLTEKHVEHHTDPLPSVYWSIDHNLKTPGGN